MANRRLVKTLTSAPFLLVLIFALLYLWLNVSSLYNQNTELWSQRYLVYIVTFSLIIGYGALTQRSVLLELARAPFLKQIAFKFIPSFLVSYAILIIFYLVTKGQGAINPIQALSYVDTGTIIFQAIVVAQIEEIMFRGILFETLYSRYRSLSASYIATAFVFAIFHFFSSGGSYIVLATYIPLSFIWTYLKLNGYPYLNRRFPTLFGPTNLTQQSNAGSHFAWNLFILGFIRPFN